MTPAPIQPAATPKLILLPSSAATLAALRSVPPALAAEVDADGRADEAVGARRRGARASRPVARRTVNP